MVQYLKIYVLNELSKGPTNWIFHSTVAILCLLDFIVVLYLLMFGELILQYLRGSDGSFCPEATW